MSLYELYRMAQANANSSQDLNPPCSSGQSSLQVPFSKKEGENDLCELVWENGQILMQNHSNTPKRAAASKSLPSQCLPSYSPRGRDRHTGHSSNPRTGKFEEFESVIDDIPMSVPSSEMGLRQDEDLVPWLSYAMNHSQHHGYSSELLPELSVVTSNELPNRNNFSLIDKRSSDSHTIRNSHKHYGQDGGAAILDFSSSRLYQSSSLQSQTSITSLRPRELEVQNKGSNGRTHLFSDNLTQVRSTGGFSDFKMQTQDLKLPSSSSAMMNFSHFAQPAALLRSNLKTTGATCGLSSARNDTVASKAKDFAARSKHIPTSTPIESDNGNTNKSTSQATKQPSKADLPPMESKPDQQCAVPVKQSEPVGQVDGAKDEQACSQVPVENARKGVTDGERSIEPAVASSVCSVNSVEKASEDPIQHKKRKSRDNDESECHSEDVEEESMDVKHLAVARGGLGSKRSRAAEVHNLSERRRRDRINEKMRALQELIPNCNKVDKASMLDEAIEYLKTLQLQVQMMSVGAGLYMPQMMFPTAMQHMHASHMPSFSPMRVGMHMGFGMGYGMVIPDISGSSSAYPMMQLPTVRGTHFTAPPRSVQTGLHEMTVSNLEVFGQPTQGLPVSMSDAPLVSGAPLMKSMELNAYEAGSRTANMDSELMPGTEDSTVHMTPTTGANEGLNQITNQV